MVKRGEPRINCPTVNLSSGGKLPLDPSMRPDPSIKRSVKAKGAWRYKDGIIDRHESRVINGTTYTDDKDPNENRRRHESNFFITLNTNRTLNNVAPGCAEMGKEACKKTLEWLSRPENLCNCIKFGPLNTHYANDKFADVVQKIEWQACVETGEKLERLHVHIWLTIHHFSQVQVNMPTTQHWFKSIYHRSLDELGANTQLKCALQINGRPYIAVKLLPSSDWADVFKRYLFKESSGTGS
jgi:hypothetical protein